jgi:hypothetical protein
MSGHDKPKSRIADWHEVKMATDTGATIATPRDNSTRGILNHDAERTRFSTVESYMSERIGRVEAILPTLATKADIGEVRADLHKADASTKAWMVATVISLFLGFCGLILTLKSSVQTPQAPSPLSTPTIIQVPAYPQAAYQLASPSPIAAKAD